MSRVSALTKSLSDRPEFRAGYEKAQSYVRIGLALKQLRKDKGWTQETLAERAGIDQADISKIESGRWGRRGISYELLERLLPEFGLRMSHEVVALPGVPISAPSRAAMVEMSTLLSAG